MNKFNMFITAVCVLFLIKHARFWDADGNQKWVIFPFNWLSHNHIYIAMYLFSIRDD